MSSTLVFDAASTSIRSTKRPSSISTQALHSPQGSEVTPVSQFYFQQAFNNVMFGPWQKIAPPYGKMVLGYFGKTPVAPDQEIWAMVAFGIVRKRSHMR